MILGVRLVWWKVERDYDFSLESERDVIGMVLILIINIVNVIVVLFLIIFINVV